MANERVFGERAQIIAVETDIETSAGDRAVFNNKNIVIEKEYITDELYKKENIMLGLRLSEGVDIEYFKDIT